MNSKKSTQSDKRTVECLDSWDQFFTLESVWNTLLEYQEFTTIFHTFDWLSIWAETFGSSHQPRVLVVQSAGEPVAIAPFLIKKTDNRRELYFIGDPNADYQDIIGRAAPDKAIAIVEWLATHRDEWDTVYLRQLSERSQWLSPLVDALQSLGLKTVRRPAETCLAFEWEEPQEKRADFQLHHGRNFRKMDRLLDSLGGSQIRRVDDLDRALQVLEKLFQLHAERWLGTLTPSKFAQKIHRDFYRRLTERLWDDGHVYISELWIDDLAVANSFNYDYNGVIYHYTIAFNSVFARKSPGAYFLTIQTEKFIHDGFNLDYCRGSQEYKEGLANRSFTNYELRVESSTLRHIAGTTYEAIKKQPTIASFIARPDVQMTKSRLSQDLSIHGPVGAVRRWLGGQSDDTTEPPRWQLMRFTGSPPEEPPFAVEQLGPNDANIIAASIGVDLQSKLFEDITQQLERGARALVIKQHRNIVAITLLATKASPVIASGAPLKSLPPEAAFVTPPVISPVLENPQIPEDLLQAAIFHSAATGKPIFSVVPCTEKSHIELMERAGFSKIEVLAKADNSKKPAQN